MNSKKDENLELSNDLSKSEKRALLTPNGCLLFFSENNKSFFGGEIYKLLLFLEIYKKSSPEVKSRSAMETVVGQGQSDEIVDNNVDTDENIREIVAQELFGKREGRIYFSDFRDFFENFFM